MRRLTADKRVLAAAALLGLLLAGLGAYAIFREILQARIEVRTGSFDFDIEDVKVAEFAGDRREDPDIAKCEYKIADDRKSVQIRVNNTYPRYRCEINLTFLNDPAESSIPGRFEGKEVRGNPADWLRVSYVDPDPNARIDVGGRAQARIIIEVTDQAPERGSSSFEVRYTFRQFLPNP